MASSLKTTSAISRSDSITPSRHTRFRGIENIIIIWFDSNINESNQNTKNLITSLHRIVNSIRIFTDPDQCVDYLTEIKSEKVFLIVSGSVGRNIVPRFDDIPQLASIYITDDDQPKHEEWIRNYIKVKGIFTQIDPLCNALKNDVRRTENDLTPISIVPSSSTVDLNQLDSSFMYSQLLKEILLQDQFDEQEQKQQFIDFCRLHYAHNNEQLKVIDEFDKMYPRPSPVWWYTRDCFIYSMINKALRTQDIEVIIKMGFFMGDLHRQIEELHSQLNRVEPLTVYRGQGMFNAEFQKMQNNQGGLLSFNNFISTTIDQQVSRFYADSLLQDPDPTVIHFRIEIDPSNTTIPFALVDEISYYGNTEKEVLFSMHTVFRIGEIKEIEHRLFQVDLTLTQDNDQQLTILTQYMRGATEGSTRMGRLGLLMAHMGEFERAEEIYTTLVATSDNDQKELAFLHNQLGFINSGKGDLVNALTHYRQSLDINLTYLKSDDPTLGATQSNIGMILQKQGDLDGAKTHFERALHLVLRASEPDQLTIAGQHNNIGMVLYNQGKYSEALNSYERALEIGLIHLPSRHSLLAATYNNIGGIHSKMGDKASALPYFEKALDIENRSLPSNHPSLMTTHKNIAVVLIHLRRSREAIQHFERAVDIGRLSLGSTHSEVQRLQQFLDKLR